jgi:hypothetical protein
MKPLVFSEQALNLIGTRDLTPEWFLSPTELKLETLSVTETDDGIYLLSADTKHDARLLVINRDENGLFNAIPPAERRQVFWEAASS